ncbi:MAG TPA: HAMP domain-containing protein, partial [Nannocystis exedens]|nr:HAMP domain-containing protein [Nannocystis exedens]
MVVKRHNRFTPPILNWGIRGTNERRLQAVLTADAGSATGQRWLLLSSLLGLLVILGIGALPLARSLVHRLAAVEDGAGKIAEGALDHRLPLPPGGPKDEVDRLAAAFNQMAGRLEDLISGQRILLANVSHELRTPVARMRVLVEILEARTEFLSKGASDETQSTIDRLHRGMGELTEDLLEIEALINDLLTSGRLELAADGGIEQSALLACEFLDRVGERFEAETSAEPANLVLIGDSMLLERLLSNLLSNARRACPNGK